jgi:hypothetical protein
MNYFYNYILSSGDAIVMLLYRRTRPGRQRLNHQSLLNTHLATLQALLGQHICNIEIEGYSIKPIARQLSSPASQK